MPRVTSMGHVGLYVTDLARSKDFYTRLLGFQVSDEQLEGDLKIVFLTLNPAEEHHHVVLVAGRRAEDGARVLNQLSMHVESLEDLREYQRIFKAEQVKITRVISHGISVSIYFLDPDGNQCEVYVPTPWYTPQPVIVPISLDQSDEAIWAEVRQICETRPGFMLFEDWQAKSRVQV